MNEYETIAKWASERIEYYSGLKVDTTRWDGQHISLPYCIYSIYADFSKTVEISFCKNLNFIVSSAPNYSPKQVILGDLGDPEFFKRLDEALVDVAERWRVSKVVGI